MTTWKFTDVSGVHELLCGPGGGSFQPRDSNIDTPFMVRDIDNALSFTMHMQNQVGIHVMRVKVLSK